VRLRAPFALLLLLLVMGLAPTQAGAVPRTFWGVATGDDQPTTFDFQRMAAARVGVARMPLHWPSIQAIPGIYDWSRIDPVVAAAASSGIELLPFLYATPRFVANCAGIPDLYCERVTPLRSPNGAEAWFQFVTAAVQRYGPSGTFWSNPLDAYNPPYFPIRRWQNWNEANSTTFYRPRPNPREYARLQVLFSQAIRAVDPGARLYLGGLYGTPPKPSFSGWEFLRRLYKVKGFKRHFDAIGLHPYSPGNKGIIFQLERFRQVLTEVKDRNTAISLTELGWASADRARAGSVLYKGLAGQARQLRSSYRMLLKNRRRYRIDSLYWFSWRDIPLGTGGACSTCESSGLLTDGLMPKPAFTAFLRFTGGS
jgi:hypothetical protein